PGRKGDPTEGREDHEDLMAKGCWGTKRFSHGGHGAEPQPRVGYRRVGVSAKRRRSVPLAWGGRGGRMQECILPSIHSSTLPTKVVPAASPSAPCPVSVGRLGNWSQPLIKPDNDQ